MNSIKLKICISYFHGYTDLDDLGGLYEVNAVLVVLFNAGRDGEDVGVKDDVVRVEAHLVHQDVVGACADVGLPLKVSSLQDRKTCQPC